MRPPEINPITTYQEPEMPVWLERRINPPGEPISATATEWLLSIVRQGTWIKEDGVSTVHAIADEDDYPVVLTAKLQDNNVLTGKLEFEKPSHNGTKLTVPFSILPPADPQYQDQNMELLCNVLEDQFHRTYLGTGHATIPQSWHKIIGAYARFLEVSKPNQPAALFFSPRAELDVGRLMSAEPAPWLTRILINAYIQSKHKIKNLFKRKQKQPIKS